MPIKVLNRKVGIEGIIPLETLTEYKVMCVIHPEAVRSLWVDKQYIQSLKQLSHCDITMIILKLKDNKIDTIEFTNFGKYKMTDGMNLVAGRRGQVDEPPADAGIDFVVALLVVL